MHDCLVLHVTGHSGDPLVVRHEQNCHSGVREPKSRIISKENNYVAETVTELASWICTKPVHEILDSLFRSPRFLAAVGIRGHLSTVSASHLLARLEHWTALHWPSLDSSTQSRVLHHFERHGKRLLLRHSLAAEAVT